MTKKTIVEKKDFIGYVADIVLLGREMYSALEEGRGIGYIMKNKNKIARRLNYESNPNTEMSMKKLLEEEAKEEKELSDYVKKYYASR